MSIQQQNHYKDKKPEETIQRLQEILQDIGIETEEIHVPISCADTYSMRVNIKGSSLGSNGKGVSKSYAKASAYAEFFERLQNELMMLSVPCEKSEMGFRHFHDEKQMTSVEIAALDNTLMNNYFKSKGLEKADLIEKAEYFKKLHRAEFQYYHEEDSYEVRPYYSVKTRKVEYLPWILTISHYGSNGMSAGNTSAEALVQAFSEIIERYVQKKICMEMPGLPDIPDEYIKKFPYIWKRIQMLKGMQGYKIVMKDCSFGGKYPVAALLIIHTDTGRYGLKLGCHPDYGIAMERAITEAAQGNDFTVYSDRSYVDFTNKKVSEELNIYNSFKFGEAQYPYQIFDDEPGNPFVPMEDISGWSNQKILDKIIAKITDEGYDILIRDVSYTGFASYQVLIPGISELMPETAIRARALNTKAYLMKILNYPEKINGQNIKYIIGSFDYWSESMMENYMNCHYIVYPNVEFPGEEMRLGWLYMTSMCYAFLEKWEEAAGRMLHLVAAAGSYESNQLDKYKAIWYYLTARNAGHDHAKTIRYLKKLFSETYSSQMDAIFCRQDQILTKQYKRNDYLGIFGEPDLTTDYQIWIKVWSRFRNYQAAHPIDQQELDVVIYQGRSANAIIL